MGLKIKTGLLLCLMSAAVCSCLAAYRSMHFSSSAVPEEIYAQFMDSAPLAEYYLRDSSGHVAVFSSRRDKTPLAVTPDRDGLPAHGRSRAMLRLAASPWRARMSCSCCWRTSARDRGAQRNSASCSETVDLFSVMVYNTFRYHYGGYIYERRFRQRFYHYS